MFWGLHARVPLGTLVVTFVVLDGVSLDVIAHAAVSRGNSATAKRSERMVGLLLIMARCV